MAVIRADFDLARERAHEVLRIHGVTAPPIPVHEIAAAMGLDVFEGFFEPPNDREVAGYLVWQERKIVLNAQDSEKRKRFTLAHELGHVELHRHEIETNPNLGIVFREQLRDVSGDFKEQEANYFAACLLMPANIVCRYYPQESVRSLASIFGVSEDAMTFRLSSLERSGLLLK